MKRFLILLAALVLCAAWTAQAPAQNKFSNKDTARDRRDFTMGTQDNSNDISIEDQPGQDTVVRSTPSQNNQQQQYNNAIDGPIFVYPQVTVPTVK